MQVNLNQLEKLQREYDDLLRVLEVLVRRSGGEIFITDYELEYCSHERLIVSRDPSTLSMSIRRV